MKSRRGLSFAGGLTVDALLERGVPADSLILVSRTPERLAEYPGFAIPSLSFTTNDFSTLTGREPTTLHELLEANREMLIQ